MSSEAISELNQALDTAGVGYTSEIYPGTIHGFTRSDTDASTPPHCSTTGTRLRPLLDRALANN